MVWRGILLVAALLAGSGPGKGQVQTPQRMSPQAHPAFEVESIRLSDPSQHRQGIHADSHRMVLHGQTVTSMMIFACGVHPSQILEGPEWRSQDRYDIEGVIDLPGQPNTQQMQEIVLKLLASRFGMTLHHDKRELRYYAVVPGKGGLKLAPSAAPQAQPENYGNEVPGGIEMKFNNFTVAHFALAMQYFMDRPLVDETGLPEMYDFTLKWAPGDAQSPDGNAPPGIFTAVQEQLGLKLEARKGPVDVVVIDRLERPSAN